MNGNDTVVLILVIGALMYWLWRWFSAWLQRPWDGSRGRPLPIEGDLPEPDSKLAELLESHGYEMVSGKLKLGIEMRIDDVERLESRIYVDGFAEKEGSTYLVIAARDRKPMEWTGSGVRDRLLSYALLYSLDGILYADPEQGTVRHIVFTLEPQ